MDPQEIKERYQNLLHAYHYNQIDWKSFQEELFKIKQERAAAASNDDDTDPSLDDNGAIEMVHDLTTDETLPIASRSSIHPKEAAAILMDDVMETETDEEHSTDSTMFQSAVGRSLASSIHPRQKIPHRLRQDRLLRLDVGDMLAERFILQRQLGYGQCGETWRAKELKSDNFVVVKPVPKQIQDDEKAWKTFRETFRRSASLQHESICPIYRLEWDEHLGFFMVSAFLDALTLDEYYERYCRTLRELPEKAALRILWPIARALDFAHRKKIYHGALKPQNIFAGKYCGAMSTDFGYTRTAKDELLRLGFSTDAADMLPYQAPEIWAGQTPNAASDQFALAILACELLSGTRPFSGKNEKEVRDKIQSNDPQLDSALDPTHITALTKALAIKPEDRFASCLDFVKMLGVKESEAHKPGGRGPHFDTSKAPQEQRRPFWAVLFGLGATEPALPEWLAETSDEKLWPFEDTAPSSTSSGRISHTATFPYKIPPASNVTTATSLLTPATALGGGFAALALGAAIAIGATNHSAEPSPAQQTIKISDGRRTSAHDISIPNREDQENQNDHSSTQNTQQPSDELTNDPATQMNSAEQMAEWTRKADGGDVDSQRRLAEAYLSGNGVEKDEEKALRYFRRAVGSGNWVSFYYLGYCYETGQGGLVPDQKTAVSYYEKSAANGNEKAQQALQRLAEQDNSPIAREALKRIAEKNH